MAESEKKEKKEEPIQENRRNFLKLVLTVGAAATLASVLNVFRLLTYVPPPQGGTNTGPPAWPVLKIANVSTLDPATPLRFNYPLVDTPSIMVKVGTAVENGVGPDSDVVAFSGICQHLGCFYSALPTGASPPCNSSFTAAGPQGYCCCHGGQYDFKNGAAVISGPPPRPVPPVTLRFDSATGDIYAIGMGGPTIFGHGPPGTTDPALVLQYDLQGGDIVTEGTLFST
ncbi:MAG TPA: Rieske 2Fe-2S domain-containing protein [Nitrososphaerales archaeon]|nr:Rieske 2Fe-2S domain-containing protein [Nitrososphaerales archaeon]